MDLKKEHDEKYSVESYIRSHPFPYYEDMKKKLTAEESGDYNSYNHAFIKVIYENLSNDDVINLCYDAIREQGGTRAVSHSYYILCNYSPARFIPHVQEYIMSKTPNDCKFNKE